MVVPVLLGSVRSERMGIRAARWIVKELERRGHDSPLVDASELKLPLLDKMWKEIKEGPTSEYSDLHATLAPLAQLYARADGFCIVSAEYNHSISPGLSNLIDYFLEEYFFRPSAIVCYSRGQFGGVRAAMQLRAMLAEVGMPPIPSLLPIPKIGDALSEDGTAQSTELTKRSGKFLAEFEWYMRALKVEREKGVPY